MTGGRPTAPIATGRSPCVSVIIIFLNPGRYLSEAIDSVVGQTFSDWELILVDDGSSDQSTEVALRWARLRPSQIRYVDHPDHANRGMSESRNRGIREARGRYVAFLDADDVYLPQRLAAHVAVLERQPCVAMVQSDQVYWYCWRDRLGREAMEECSRPPMFLGDAVIRPPQGLYMLFGVPDAFNAPSSLTIRRSVALDLGGFENQFRSLYEDQVFLTKVYAHRIVYALQRRLVKYRIHAGGSLVTALAESGDGQSRFFEAGRRLRDWQTQYLAGLSSADELVHRMLDEQRRRAHEAGRTRVHGMRMAARHAIRDLLRSFLPVGLYRRVLHRRQRWSADRSRLQYAALCSQLSGALFARRRVE